MLTEIYRRLDRPAVAKPTDLVFAWTHLQKPFKAWLGVGVPELDEPANDSIAEAVGGLDLIVARGSLSRERLIRNGATADAVRQSPDLGWLFPRLLDDRPAPTPPGSGRPYAVIQLIPYHTPTSQIASLARQLRKLSDTYGLAIVLLPLTTCWGDHDILRALYDEGRGDFVLIDYQEDVLDKLALLGGAALYVGQSMHGLIWN